MRSHANENCGDAEEKRRRRGDENRGREGPGEKDRRRHGAVERRRLPADVTPRGSSPQHLQVCARLTRQSAAASHDVLAPRAVRPRRL